MTPPHTRIRELEAKLAEAQDTIKALLSDQVDAIVDTSSGTPLLLSTAQSALRDSEERYRRILETTQEGIWLTDANGSTTYVNGSMAAMLGCDALSCVGKQHADFLDADESQRLTYHVRGGSPEPIALRFERPDGTSVWTLFNVVPVRDHLGAPDGLLAMATDVSERRNSARALRFEQERAQQVLDTAEVFLVSFDIDGRIVLVNRYACDALGQSVESLIGRSWIESCVPERFHDGVRARFAALLEGDLSVVENPIVTSSGDERLIEWRNTLQRDEAGAVTGIFSSGVDVTDRHRAAEDLRAAEERIRFALEAAGIGTWDQDYASGTVQWSEILEAQYGLAPGEFDGTFETFAGLVHPEDRDALLTTMDAAMRSGSDFVTHHRVVHADGSVRFIAGAGRVLLDDRGQPLRAVGISRDVTDREDLERRYQHSQRMEAFGQLAGGIAHDFNNILSVILTCGEFLLTDLKPRDPARADVEEIIKAGRRAADLTRQLLMFSRKQVLAPRVFALAAVTEGLSGMLERVVGEDMTITYRHDGELGRVRADPGSIEQVLLNLVVNARDAMPTGGALTIETRNETVGAMPPASLQPASLAPGRYVVLSVTDSGMGMDKATQLRVFEPFFTTKAVGKGTGLGLSTAFGIVQQSLGAIEVQSELGAGTTFSVYLPQVDDAPDETLTLRAVGGSRGSESILLVEDEDQVRTIARTILERHGYHVIEQRSGAGALAHCRQAATEIDLLLTDVVMPQMGGPELAKRVAEIFPHIKVLFMSGYTDDSVVRHGVLKGESDFLQKPFTSAELTHKVRSVLDGEPPSGPVRVVSASRE